MQRRGRCLRWLISGMTASTLCLVTACTTQSPAINRNSSEPSSAAASASPAATTNKLDFTTVKRKVEKDLDSGDFSLAAVRAVLVNVDGETRVSVYRQSGPKDYSDVFSVTKSVVSILVGIAIGEGRLELDDTLPELLPEYASRMNARARTVTLRQLLTMTAGVDAGDVFDSDTKDAVGQIIRYGFGNEPGVDFVYANGSAHLVAGILQHAVDRPLLDYAREKLFDPLGIDTRPAHQGSDLVAFRKPGFGWLSDREGINLGSYGLKLTAPDMIKIGRLYLDKGRWHGHQLVPAQWVKESTVDQLTTERSEFTDSAGYGYFWWTSAKDHPSFAARGSYGQTIIVVPDHRLIIVTLADESGLESGSEAFFDMITEDIMRPILDD